MNRLARSTIDSQTSSSSVQYHYCHNRGRVASRCPQRTLTLKQEPKDQIKEVDQIVEPEAYSKDEHELKIKDAHVNIVCIILSTTSDSNEWKRISIYHTLIRSKERTCKLVIDRGSTMNVS